MKAHTSRPNKFKGVVGKHKSSLFVTVNKVKMMSLAKKEGNKPVKVGKPVFKGGLSKANRVRCANCSMCGGCGFFWRK